MKLHLWILRFRFFGVFFWIVSEEYFVGPFNVEWASGCNNEKTLSIGITTPFADGTLKMFVTSWGLRFVSAIVIIECLKWGDTGGL